jgi:hypothetical protein
MLDKISFQRNKVSSHVCPPPSPYSPFSYRLFEISRQMQTCLTNRRDLPPPTPVLLQGGGGGGGGDFSRELTLR